MIAGLHLLHVFDVGRIEQLSADDGGGKLRRRPENLLDAGRHRPFPFGAHDHVVARCGSRCARADIAKIIGVAVAELH